MKKFFKNLKVVELASVLAGPAVGLFFRELGAKVIKIENKKTGGDVTRIWKLPSEKAENQSAYYSNVNWKKKTLFLNLSDKKDFNKALKEIETADIVISNFRSESAKKLKLDYKSIKKINPKIIYGLITGFGEDSTRPAFDVVLQAETGFLFMNGKPDESPVKMPVALIDLMAAHQLKEGILVALLKRAQSGKGSKVSVSLYESAIASLANQATNWLMADHIPQPMGTQHPNIAPYGDMFETKDGKRIVLAIGNEKQFQLLCNTMKMNKLAGNSKFSTNKSRVKNRAELNEFLAKKISELSSKKLNTLFLKNDIPFGLVKNMKEVFENQMAQEMILEEQLPSGQVTKRVRSSIFKIEDNKRPR